MIDHGIVDLFAWGLAGCAVLGMLWCREGARIQRRRAERYKAALDNARFVQSLAKAAPQHGVRARGAGEAVQAVQARDALGRFVKGGK